MRAAEEVTPVTCAVFSHGRLSYTVFQHSLYVNITYSSDYSSPDQAMGWCNFILHLCTPLQMDGQEAG